MSKKVVLAGACRTAIGTMGGGLSTIPVADLGSIVIKEALNRAGVKPDQVDHVYMGCVIQAGQGQNVARQAAIAAGLPVETTAVTVNVVCGSGLDAVNMAAQMIRSCDHPQARSIPIIAMSSNLAEDNEGNCLAAGMNAFIPKPIKGDKLLKLIVSVLQNS